MPCILCRYGVPSSVNIAFDICLRRNLAVMMNGKDCCQRRYIINIQCNGKGIKRRTKLYSFDHCRRWTAAASLPVYFVARWTNTHTIRMMISCVCMFHTCIRISNECCIAWGYAVFFSSLLLLLLPVTSSVRPVSETHIITTTTTIIYNTRNTIVLCTEIACCGSLAHNGCHLDRQNHNIFFLYIFPWWSIPVT